MVQPEPQEAAAVQVEEEEEVVKKKGGEANVVSFWKLLSYADALDWVLMGLGTLGAMVHGLALPMGYFLLGKALDAFGNNIHDTKGMVKALEEVEIGCWMYASERQLACMRLGFLEAVLTFFSGVLIAFICCWEVSLLNLFVVPLILLIGATYTKKLNLIAAAKMLYLSKATSLVEQTISQIKTVFSFVGEDSAIKSFSDCMDKQSVIGRGEALIKGIGTGMFQTVTNCSWALVIWVGAIVVTAKRASGGDILAAIMSILFGAISITYAAPDMQIFEQAKAAGTEVFELIQRKPVITYGEKTLEQVEGNIDIQDVYFSYPSREDKLILQGLSLSIPAGKTVALVGSSGCGKSTVISLVARFYDPSKGAILIDNHNIKDLDLRFLRRNIGAVSQEPSLFSGTIKDNLRVGKMDASDEEIEKAAIMANAHSFVSGLPDKYLTDVGQRGFQLSGGQKQRIAIARAILKDPPILLLDEATSALDSESEKLVQEALEKAMQGRTVILIAHRMSTIVNADMIAIFEDGKVRETGTHQSLLDTSDYYNKLFNMQNIAPAQTSRDAEAVNVITSDTPGPSINTGISFSLDSDAESKETLGPQTSQQEEKLESSQATLFFRVWYGLRKREFFKIALGSIAAGFSGISKPLFGFFIITIGAAYYDPDAKRQVGWYSIIFSAVGLLSLVTHILQHYYFGRVGETAMMNFRKALFSGILRNELCWFEKPENSIGAVTSRIISDTSMVKVIISDRMSVIVQCISSILIATVVSMIVDWRMALVAWAVMPCHFIGGLIQAKSAKGFASDYSTAHRELVSLASESATNIRTVASFCYEDRILNKAKESLIVPMRKSRRASIKYGIIQGFSLLLWNIAHAVALWYTTILVERGQASFKNGIRAYQIFSLTVPSITELYTLIPTVISAISVLTPAFMTLDRKTEIEPDVPKNFKAEKNIKGTVEFKSVKFNYPSRPEATVLNGFSLKIEAGKKVALVGPSGAGKSSVLALILRFYDPMEGKVLIDGKDVKDYNLRWLRTQIGFVQQEPLLFSSSIRDNICYGNESASETEIAEASREANIHEFISNLPNGYDTVVGEKGCQLSGGQKQRIAIARTLLKRPAIFLLDEATSALDAESERSVVSALESINLNRTNGGFLCMTTQITVAHRLSTIVKSDKIIVMDRGAIAETGTHLHLISNSDGIYSRLYRLQSMKGE
ncbi:hypothetical protein CDL15_Pgr021652 [Punica granatum]|uniref:ABC transporter B family member 19-like n=1 Tax=Punica granatum TaxID=22663 RepID=A0A218WSP4_PUNGR|nr:hypothetical protein CDL15_Pgr021652 [Punica granatum]